MTTSNPANIQRLAIIRESAIRLGIARERTASEKPLHRRPNPKPFGSAGPHPALPDWRNNPLRRYYPR